MAAVPMTFTGILTGDYGRTENVTFVGLASATGLGVGGGPLPGGPGGQPPTGVWPPGSGIDMPAHPIAPGGPPPSVWPSPGVPAHPIVLPPYEPGGPPVQIWPSPGHPAHPIVIPPPPEPPTEGGKPPPDDGGWGYHPDYGWGYFPPQSDKPQPGPPPA